MGYEYYMNDPRFWRGIIEVLDASWEATKKRFAKYNKLNEDIMEEKKTKKMTKAEAFEYLKSKKVKCYMVGEHHGEELLKKLAECGCTSNIFLPKGILSIWAIFISDVCDLSILDTAHADQYGNYDLCEISADDILSIEIVEDKNNEFVDCSEPCPEIKAVQELLRNSNHLKDKIIVITKDNAAIL